MSIEPAVNYDEILDALFTRDDFNREKFDEGGKLTHEQYARWYAREMYEGAASKQRQQVAEKTLRLLELAERAWAEGYRLKSTSKIPVGVGTEIPDTALAWRRVSAGYVAMAEHYRLAYLVKI